MFDPAAHWPVRLAANRDEMLARPWAPPAAHWPNHPGIVGGLDREGGGTWLAVDRAHRRVAAVLNRTGSLGPAAGKRSRGELPLLALIAGIAAIEAGAYRPFNLIVAEATEAWFIRGTGDGPVARVALPPGLTMLTAGEPNDEAEPRIARHLPRFAAAAPPTPPDWGAWPSLLADQGGEAKAALNIPPRHGFGTSSSALVGIGHTIDFRFAAGPPHQAPFATILGEET